jgi:hypothetical protein
MSDADGSSEERVLSPEEIRAHAEHDHIGAVFAERRDADAAVDELRSAGFGSEHLGVAIRGTDSVAFEHDDGGETLRDATTGAVAGVPVGVLAGLALAAISVPGLGLGVLVVGGGAGAWWGALVGGYAGVARRSRAWDEHRDIELLPRQPGEVMVVVCGHGHADMVGEVLRRHGGRPVELPHPPAG